MKKDVFLRMLFLPFLVVSMSCENMDDPSEGEEKNEAEVRISVPVNLPEACTQTNPDDDPDSEKDVDAGVDTDSDNAPACKFTINFQADGLTKSVTKEVMVSPNDEKIELIVPAISGVTYNVTAKLEDIQGKAIFQLDEIQHTFERGVNSLTLWLNEVVDNPDGQEFNPMHIASLLAKDNEPNDNGSEYIVEKNGTITFQVSIGGVTTDDAKPNKILKVTGSTPNRNCGVISEFVPVVSEGSPNPVFQGTWTSPNIAETECALTLAASEMDGDTLVQTAAISFMTYTSPGGDNMGINRDLTAEFNTAPVISDVKIDPTQLNLSMVSEENYVVTILGTDQEQTALEYDLALAKGLKRIKPDSDTKEDQCLLLEIAPHNDTDTNSFNIKPLWGICPEQSDSTPEYIEYNADGPNSLSLKITVTEPAISTPVTDLYNPLSTQATLIVPVINQGVMSEKR